MLALRPSSATILPFPAFTRGREPLPQRILAALGSHWTPRSLDQWHLLLGSDSRATIHRCLHQLEAEGQIEVRAGIGARPAAYRLASADVRRQSPESLDQRVADLERLVASMQATITALESQQTVVSHQTEMQTYAQLAAQNDHAPHGTGDAVLDLTNGTTACISPHETQDETQGEDAFLALIRSQLERNAVASCETQGETQGTTVDTAFPRSENDQTALVSHASHPETLPTLNVNVKTLNESTLNVNDDDVDYEPQRAVATLEAFGLTAKQAQSAVTHHHLTPAEAEAWVEWGTSLQGVRSRVAVVVASLRAHRLPPGRPGPAQRVSRPSVPTSNDYQRYATPGIGPAFFERERL